MRKNILLLLIIAIFLFVYPVFARGKKDQKASRTAPVNIRYEETYIVLDNIAINSKYRIDILNEHIFIVADDTLFLFNKPAKNDIERMKRENENAMREYTNGNSNMEYLIPVENSADAEQIAREETEKTQGKENEIADRKLYIQPINKIENILKTFIYAENYYYIDNARKIFVFDNGDFHAYNITIPEIINIPLFEETETVAKKETKVIDKWYNEFIERITNSIDVVYSATDEDNNNFPRWLEFKKYANKKSKKDGYMNNVSAIKFSSFNNWFNNFYREEYNSIESEKTKKRESFNNTWGVNPSGEYPFIEFPAIMDKINYSGKSSGIKQFMDIHNNLVGIYNKNYTGKNISRHTIGIFNSTYKAIVSEIKELEKNETAKFEQEKKECNEGVKSLDGKFIEKIKDSLESIQFEYAGQNSQYIDYVFLPAYKSMPAYLITNNLKSSSDNTIAYKDDDIQIDLPGFEDIKLIILKPVQRSEL